MKGAFWGVEKPYGNIPESLSKFKFSSPFGYPRDINFVLPSNKTCATFITQYAVKTEHKLPWRVRIPEAEHESPLIHREKANRIFEKVEFSLAYRQPAVRAEGRQPTTRWASERNVVWRFSQEIWRYYLRICSPACKYRKVEIRSGRRKSAT